MAHGRDAIDGRKNAVWASGAEIVVVVVVVVVAVVVVVVVVVVVGVVAFLLSYFNRCACRGLPYPWYVLHG